MRPAVRNGHISAHCPDCQGVYSSFDQKGVIDVRRPHEYQGRKFTNIHYVFCQCTGCLRGGIAKIHDDGDINQGVVELFFPYSIEKAQIPQAVPSDIVAEFREAELCSSVGALRAASALFRSTLEKTLKANGYVDGGLQGKIVAAATDGILTEPRRQRADSEVKALGNDVLHDEWREVTQEEVDAAHHYTQRILEDLYDHREEVVRILTAKGRIEPETA